ncbi:hypothetical protein GCM10009092_22610 [Bowmanella denitrificans]|uniref:Serine dehydrogenase proteinase n=1 Tax=Bowmanella denitrificans TaxID=366582 RepID=A0ABN0X8K2_9ALTE
MSQLETTSFFSLVRAVEEQRNSKVLVLAASHLEMELLPQLYDQLQSMGPCERLDVLVHARGGEVNATRRIALLLRQHCDKLGFIVPYVCQSAATLLCLVGDEILAGPLAMFSPIDPHLHGGTETEQDVAMSSEDVRLFGAMCQEWFGVEAEQARQESLQLLCQSIFPPSLTAFYRTTLEIKQIAMELLAYQLPHLEDATRAQLIEELVSGYHSHGYALSGQEMQRMGLNCVTHQDVQALAWQVSRQLQATVGGAQRNSADEPWCDALLASNKSVLVRQRNHAMLAGCWHSLVDCHD